MPHIPQEDRLLAADTPATPGELNYALTQLCLEYLERTDGRYADHAEVVAALECAKLEFYRLAVAPLENRAIAKNGIAYPIVGSPLAPT